MCTIFVIRALACLPITFDVESHYFAETVIAESAILVLSIDVDCLPTTAPLVRAAFGQ